MFFQYHYIFVLIMLLYYTLCTHGSAQLDNALQVSYENNKKESPSVFLKNLLYNCTTLHANAQQEFKKYRNIETLFVIR